MLDAMTLTTVLLSNATLYLAVRFGPRMVRPALWVRTEPELPMPSAVTAQPARNEPLDADPPAPEIRSRPHYRATPKKVIPVAKAVDVLIAYMNEEGHRGLFTATEIDEWWSCCCANNDIEHLDPQFVREALDAAKLKVGLKRLNTPEYVHVRQRCGKTRCVLYRIPHRRGMSETLPDTPVEYAELPGESRDKPGASPAVNRAQNHTPNHPNDQQRRAA